MSYSRIFRAPPHPGHLPWLAPVLTRTRSFVLTCSSRGLRPSCFDLLLPETCDAATVYVLDSDTLLPETCDASGWVRRGLHDVAARARQDPSREGRTRIPACSTRTCTNARLHTPVVLCSDPNREGRAESESLRVSRCARISGLPGTGPALGVFFFVCVCVYVCVCCVLCVVCV